MKGASARSDSDCRFLFAASEAEASGACLHLLMAVHPPLAAIAQMGVRLQVDPWQARKKAIAVRFSVPLMSLHSGDNCGCSGKFSLQRVGASHVLRHSNFELLLHLNSTNKREKMNFELERQTHLRYRFCCSLPRGMRSGTEGSRLMPPGSEESSAEFS